MEPAQARNESLDSATHQAQPLVGLSSADVGSPCDTQRVHEIMSVQPHGCFLAVSLPSFTVTHVSTNIFARFPGFGRDEVVEGERLARVTGREFALAVEAKWKSGVLQPRARHVFRYGFPAWDVHMVLLADDILGIEIEDTVLDNQEPSVLDKKETLAHLIGITHKHQDRSLFWREACRAVRLATGLDRVMLYRFLPPSWHGEVVAEDRVAEAHSFLGHRFPSSDIPAPARELYLKNKVRFILDGTVPDVDIVPAGKSRGAELSDETPLNLTHSRLRGVSQFHKTYMGNMGVRSSLSIAVEVHGKLWGLIACHSASVCPVSHETRALCESIADVLSNWIPLADDLNQSRSREAAHACVREILCKIGDASSPVETLMKESHLLFKGLDTNGLAWVQGDHVEMSGLTPLREDIRQLARFWEVKWQEMGRPIGPLSTSSLREWDKRWESLSRQVSGVMGVSLGQGRGTLFAMRPEEVQNTRWGGDPRETLAKRAYSGLINPRHSFETWLETVHHRSKPWEAWQEGAWQHLGQMLSIIPLQKGFE
jgi:two-component system, chemotaxis family, sensor kinase Cph1